MKSVWKIEVIDAHTGLPERVYIKKTAKSASNLWDKLLESLDREKFYLHEERLDSEDE